MIQAQSAFFNKGNMLKPWFVQSIDNPISKKTFYKGEKKIAGKPITSETADKVETELDKVVNSDKSHASNYRIDGYDIEGKQVLLRSLMKMVVDTLKEQILLCKLYGRCAKTSRVIVYAGMSLAQKNDQEAYELGVSKAFKPIMENTLSI